MKKLILFTSFFIFSTALFAHEALKHAIISTNYKQVVQNIHVQISPEEKSKLIALANVQIDAAKEQLRQSRYPENLPLYFTIPLMTTFSSGFYCMMMYYFLEVDPVFIEPNPTPFFKEIRGGTTIFLTSFMALFLGACVSAKECRELKKKVEDAQLIKDVLISQR